MSILVLELLETHPRVKYIYIYIYIYPELGLTWHLLFIGRAVVSVEMSRFQAVAK
jgi:hypothetical protein